MKCKNCGLEERQHDAHGFCLVGNTKFEAEPLYTADDLSRVRRETVSKCTALFDKYYAGYLAVHGFIDYSAIQAELKEIEEGRNEKNTA